MMDNPEEFHSDGCTLAPDGDFRACCVAHDRAYFEGGTLADRKRADDALRECIAGVGRPVVGRIYWLAVRVFGGSWWPFGWRWTDVAADSDSPEAAS